MILHLLYFSSHTYTYILHIKFSSLFFLLSFLVCNKGGGSCIYIFSFSPLSSPHPYLYKYPIHIFSSIFSTLIFRLQYRRSILYIPFFFFHFAPPPAIFIYIKHTYTFFLQSCLLCNTRGISCTLFFFLIFFFTFSVK